MQQLALYFEDDTDYKVNKSELVHLNIMQNHVSYLGAQILFQSLLNNNSLVSLNLGNNDAQMRNHIGPKGAKYLKELLISNKFLVFVDVSGNVLCD
jgi:hypothetical protein